MYIDKYTNPYTSSESALNFTKLTPLNIKSHRDNTVIKGDLDIPLSPVEHSEKSK